MQLNFWRKGLSLFMVLGMGLLASLPSMALEKPKDRPILSVTGKIGVNNSTNAAVWDMAMLESLPQTQFTTATPWEKDPITFRGPLLRDVLSAVKANGSSIKATALNDYRIIIPAADAQAYDVIVATRMNGQAMSVRTKGPLFIVYPFDSRPELRNATYYERSIWQLKSIEID
jgi:hypothetical protein